MRTGAPIIHSVLCTLAGVLFIAFFLSALAGPVWWDGNEYDSWLRPVILFFGIALLFQIILGIWVGIDASRRGMNGFLWGALTCFTCVVGLIVYLLSAQAREANGDAGRTADVCPQCGSPARAEFLACPHCGTSLRRTCSRCAHPVEPGWKYCPHCRASLDTPQPTQDQST